MKYKRFLIPIIVYIILFWGIMFRELHLLDYSPWLVFAPSKLSISPNSLPLYSAYEMVLSFFGLGRIAFHLAIIAAFFICYESLQRMTKSSLSFIVYVFNPFLYVRLMSGQIGVVLSYLILPTIVLAIHRFLKFQDRGRFLVFLVVIATSVSLSTHMFLIGLIVTLVFISIYRPNIKQAGVLILPFIMILPILIFGTQSIGVGSIDHLVFFSAKPDPYIPSAMKIATMWGFWRESSFQTTYSTLPIGIWYLLVSLILITSFVGFSSLSSKKSTVFGLLWIIGFGLAMSSNIPVIQREISSYLNSVPLLILFRDSHKFVMLIALSYSYLLPYGVKTFEEQFIRYDYTRSLRQVAAITIPLLFLGIIFASSLPIIGMSRQISSIDIPIEYYKTEAFLNHMGADRIIYLPWTRYITFNWTKNKVPDGRILNPMNKISSLTFLIGPDQFDLLDDNLGECIFSRDSDCLRKSADFIVIDKCAGISSPYVNSEVIFSNSCVDVIKT